MSIRGSQIQVKRTVDSFEMLHQQWFIFWYNKCLTYGLTMENFDAISSQSFPLLFHRNRVRTSTRSRTMTQGNWAAIRNRSFSENGTTLTTPGSNYEGNAIAKFGKRRLSHHISAASPSQRQQACWSGS